MAVQQNVEEIKGASEQRAAPSHVLYTIPTVGQGIGHSAQAMSVRNIDTGADSVAVRPRPSLTVVGPSRARSAAKEVLEREIAAGRLSAAVNDRALLTVVRMLTGGAPASQQLERSA